MAALSSRARFVVADRCGHGIAQENPDLVAREVRLIREQLTASDPLRRARA